MQLSIRNIIAEINNKLGEYFPGATFYGVATTVESSGKSQPAVGEISVSYDDAYTVQAYYKVNGVNITYKPGYGELQTTVNTFAISAIVFNNEELSKLKPDEVAMIIQAVLAKINILSVRILPTNIILNSRQIFETEYRGVTFPLTEYKSLMQINMNVEVTFKSGCFDLCPEDFSQCKTN